MTRSIQILATALAILLFPLEAHMSDVNEYISLKQLVEKSDAVLVASHVEDAKLAKQNEKRAGYAKEEKFKIWEILDSKQEGLKREGEIIVREAHFESHKMISNHIEEHGHVGYPHLILDSYKSSLSPDDLKHSSTAILFLLEVKGEKSKWEFAAENAYESIEKKRDALQAIGPAKIIEALRSGSAWEKRIVLDTFEDGEFFELIPEVIKLVSDGTPLPRENDTGWMFLGHRAASALNMVARHLPDINGPGPADLERDKFSFHSGLGKTETEQKKRLQEVQKNWELWWSERSKK